MTLPTNTMGKGCPTLALGVVRNALFHASVVNSLPVRARPRNTEFILGVVDGDWWTRHREVRPRGESWFAEVVATFPAAPQKTFPKTPRSKWVLSNSSQ